MRNLIAIAHISLDGVIQAPGAPGEDTSNGFPYGGWVAPFSDEMMGTVIRQQMDLPFDLLLGRKTYDIWAAHWPKHGDVWPNVNAATKYVASNTQAAGEWGPSVFFGGDVSVRVREIKQEAGPDLHVYGSSVLLQALMQHDLVDAYWLKVYPVTLGSGKRLFAEGTIPAAFRVSESQVSPKGVIMVNYERAGGIDTGSFE